MIITCKLRLFLLLTLSLFVAGAMMIVEEALAAAWFDEDWLYRRQITIDHNQVVPPFTTYAGFPLFVYATGLSNINANGTDIRFTDSDGITELPREIESYSGGTLYAWVKVTLTKDSSDSIDDVIYMYYGNPAATEPAPSSPNGSENVWDNNFVMVQHLQETSGTHFDSTSNGNNGTPQNGVIQNAIGQINGADDFAGGDGDYVDISSVADDVSVIQGSVSTWVKLDSSILSDGNGHSIVSIGNSAGLNNQIIDISKTPANQISLRYKINSGSPYRATIPTPLTSFDNWHHVVGVWTATALLIYDNGVLVGTPTTPRGSDISNSLNQVAIGAKTQIDIDWFFNGSIDEVRISNIARSADWIKISYNNQDEPSAFLTVSEQVSVPTMTEWGMIIFMVLAGLVSIYYLRRQRRTYDNKA